MNKTYTKFTGSSIAPDNITGITYTTMRESAPIYTLGSANFRFTRAPKQYAGELISTTPYNVDDLISEVNIVIQNTYGNAYSTTINDLKIINYIPLDEPGYYKYTFVSTGINLKKDEDWEILT